MLVGAVGGLSGLVLVDEGGVRVYSAEEGGNVRVVIGEIFAESGKGTGRVEGRWIGVLEDCRIGMFRVDGVGVGEGWCL